MNASLEEEIVEDYVDRAHSIERISLDRNISKADVTDVLDRRGIARRRGGSQPKISREAWERVKGEKLTNGQLAERFGCGVAAVIKAKKRYGA